MVLIKDSIVKYIHQLVAMSVEICTFFNYNLKDLELVALTSKEQRCAFELVLEFQ